MLYRQCLNLSNAETQRTMSNTTVSRLVPCSMPLHKAQSRRKNCRLVQICSHCNAHTQKTVMQQTVMFGLEQGLQLQTVSVHSVMLYHSTIDYLQTMIVYAATLHCRCTKYAFKVNTRLIEDFEVQIFCSNKLVFKKINLAQRVEYLCICKQKLLLGPGE